MVVGGNVWEIRWIEKVVILCCHSSRIGFQCHMLRRRDRFPKLRHVERNP